MYLFWKPPYYLRQPSRCDQVLTGVLPYHGSDEKDIITRIHAGERPPRPTDPSQTQWLEDSVWDVITTGWRPQQIQRCKLSVMYHVFLPRDVKLGDLNTQNNSNLVIAEASQTLKQGDNKLGKSFRGSPLSSSFCEIRSQKHRGVLTK